MNDDFDRKELEEQLFKLQDTEYRDFQAGLLPGIDRESIIGIRVPVLRKFARQYSRTVEAGQFLNDLPHRFYEENNLHMMLITSIKDYDTCLRELRRFLPFIDNWSTCDFSAPACFAEHREELLGEIRAWLASGDTYTVRYGIGMLMRLYLDGEFSPEYLGLVSGVRSEEYYVNMMIAWYFATALAKQWDSAVIYIAERRLPEWVHKKTIQKAVESCRISDEQKKYLRSLR